MKNGRGGRAWVMGWPAALAGVVLAAWAGAVRADEPRAGATGVKVTNVAEAFADCAAQGAGLDEAGRVKVWDETLEGRYPDFFDQVIYRKKTGEERERFKRSLQRTFWADVAPRMESIRRAARRMAPEIESMAAEFLRSFPEFKGASGYYVTVSFTFRGKVVDVNGENVFAIGAEHFEAEGPQVRLTVAHELFHVYHFQFFRPSGGLYRTLWAEGLASYASDMLSPGQRMSVVLGFAPEKMNRCHELLGRMARELRDNLTEHNPKLERVYFGAEDNDHGIPPEAGYYVGYLIAESLAKGRSLDDLARMDADTARGLIVRELERMMGEGTGDAR